MKKMLYCRRILLLVLCAALMLLSWAGADQSIPVLEISKYGNLVLDISGADFMAQGYDFGDVIIADIAGTAWSMPVCSSYSDVDNGKTVCRVEAMDGPVVLAINMGSLADAVGAAEVQGLSVSVSMQEKGGYHQQWLLRQLVRTNAREDYAHLSDEAFANFRMVDTPGMGKGVLYRSSSPIDPELGRSTYADAAMERAGIASVINLADAVPEYEGWEDSYYGSCSLICLSLGVDFIQENFRSGLAEGLRFIIANEGPYLVHCSEGKDRAGFVSAILECLMGAPAEAVVADYMETYYNYYGVEEGTARYDAVVQGNIDAILRQAFGVEDIYACDLAAEAQQYLLEIGLSVDEIEILRARLAGDGAAS